jgi:hypothetical protein
VTQTSLQRMQHASGVAVVKLSGAIEPPAPWHDWILIGHWSLDAHAVATTNNTTGITRDINAIVKLNDASSHQSALCGGTLKIRFAARSLNEILGQGTRVSDIDQQAPAQSPTRPKVYPHRPPDLFGYSLKRTSAAGWLVAFKSLTQP